MKDWQGGETSYSVL